MENRKRLTPGPMFAATLFLLVVCSFTFPVTALAQAAAGNKAVYKSDGTCCLASTASIDASVLFQTDICTTIHNILQPNGYSAAVIDARGINVPASSLTCTSSPWGSGTGYINKPSTILLPAGTITTSVPWILPGNTRLVGVTTGIDSNLPDTTIQASFGSGAVLQFGDSHCPSGVCQGISVEHITIEGDSSALNGIENDNCGAMCYVDYVKMYQVLGTGLRVSGANASDSGPYSNITFDVGNSTGTSTHCAQIIGTNRTRGLHGMTCIATPSANSGILLDASNNSLEDVRIIGFYNGIVVGSNAAAKSNVLLNIYGDTTQGGIQQPINLIQIYSGTVSDLAAMAVANAGGTGTNTIQDLQTSKTLSDPYVGMYVLGESNGSSGNSRFTTSPNAATWAVGTSNPPTLGCVTANLGSLYSLIPATGNAAHLWVCEVSTQGPQWTSVL